MAIYIDTYRLLLLLLYIPVEVVVDVVQMDRILLHQAENVRMRVPFFVGRKSLGGNRLFRTPSSSRTTSHRLLLLLPRHLFFLPFSARFYMYYSTI